MNSFIKHFSAIMVALAVSPASAATLTALSTFGGGDGYLAPGDRVYLPASPGDNNQRGIAWNPATNHVLLVNRTGGLSINIVDGITGNDLGTLAQGSGVIAGGTFVGSMIGAGDDGALYMTNLTTQATTTPFVVYRWANESATPTVAYSGAPLAGARLGDTLDVRGGGTSTQLVAGYGSTPVVAGNNSFALFTTADGSSFAATHVAVPGPAPAAGDFRLGITFVDSDTVIGKQSANGRLVDITSPGVGVLNTSFTLDGSNINPMDYAIVGGIPVLAAVNTAAAGESKLFVYDMTNPSLPVQLAVLDNLPGAANANGNGVGQVKFGAITGGSAVIYVLNANNGIQAFKLITIPEPASGVLLVVSFATMLVGGRIRRV
jgi:hypothetical protein